MAGKRPRPDARRPLARAKRADAGAADAVPADWPADAWRFHAATANAPWATVEAQASTELELTQAERAAAPPPYKPPRGRGLPMSLPARSGEFLRVLRERRTWRGFGAAPVTRAQLAQLLKYSFGATMTGRTVAGQPVLFKTSPSAGALHPTEAYVLAVRVAGLKPALYHFSAKTGRLHAVRAGATREQLVQYLSDQWWYGGAAALVLLTACVPRVWKRYPHARAYRSLLLDAGHVCQTFCLVATWLRLAPFCTQALDDQRIERDLKIDGINEVILYAAGVGTRPADGRWVQWPEHDPASTFLPPKDDPAPANRPLGGRKNRRKRPRRA